MVQDKKIAIIGLGYVGLPLAVEFGKTRSTLGFDISTRRIDELRLGRDSTLEVTEEEMTSAAHLAFSCDANDLGGCSIFIVTVPTPIDDVNRPDLTPIIKANIKPLIESPPKMKMANNTTNVVNEVFKVLLNVLLNDESTTRLNSQFVCSLKNSRILSNTTTVSLREYPITVNIAAIKA